MKFGILAKSSISQKYQKYQKKLNEWCHSGIAIVNLEHTDDIDLVFSLCQISMMELFCEEPFTIF